MEEYQSKETGEFRERRKLSIFPLIIVGDEFVWTGKWFTYVTVQEQKIMERYLKFDDGWTYMHYWGKWEETWEFVKIVKK